MPLRRVAPLLSQEPICKADPQVIAHLNAQLENELTAPNQCFLHDRRLAHWGYGRLAEKEYEEPIGGMHHADRLIERILVLDGLPNLQDLGKLLVGEDAVEIVLSDLQLEQASQAAVKAGIAHCGTARDYVSRLAQGPRAHPRGHRRAHRPPRDPARAGRSTRAAERPAVPGRRRLSLGRRRPQDH